MKLARQLLVDINEMGMPTATEFLDMVTGRYINDLITLGAPSGRTTESQVHREMASALSCPVGFKNGTDGNTRIAIDAVRSPPQPSSSTPRTRTADDHLPYRRQPLWPRDPARRPQTNYDTASIDEACEALAQVGLPERLVVDFNHNGSMKDHRRQLLVAQDICDPAAPRRGIAGIFGRRLPGGRASGRGERRRRLRSEHHRCRLLGRHRDPAGHAGRGRQGAVGQTVGLNRQCNERGRISAISCPFCFYVPGVAARSSQLGINQTRPADSTRSVRIWNTCSSSASSMIRRPLAHHAALLQAENAIRPVSGRLMSWMATTTNRP